MPSLATAVESETNPLLQEWKTPFGIPPLEQVKLEHYEPAMLEVMRQQKAEIEKIGNAAEEPTFANTIAAMEKSWLPYDRVNLVFDNITQSETTDALQELSKKLAPIQAAHSDSIYLNPKLFARVKTLWENRESLNLPADEATLLERIFNQFKRGGALLDEKGKERLRELNSELATLGVIYGDNVLKEMNAYKLVIEKKEDLAGLPEDIIASAAAAAKDAKLEGKWVFTLHSPSVWPFLTYSDKSELRKELFNAYLTRCNHDNATDNKKIAARLVRLRGEKARLLSYRTWADYALEEQMAATPERVYGLLNRLWDPAKGVAAREVEDMKQLAKTSSIEPWDWFYYAEKVRRARYDLDEAALRPYFELSRVRDGVFDVATRLYGLKFTPLKDVPKYHPEVEAFEVKDADGSHLAVFYADWHPRAGKRPGAWCTAFRYTYEDEGKSVRPIILNVCNFSRPAGNEPALLTVEEVETLFHEFGHALHAMLSKVRYRNLSDTPSDFVEMPSQIMENWATHPEVLKLYARHYKTGEPIPDALVQKIKKSELFNQGFRMVEYLAASLLDLDWHTLPAVVEPEAATLEQLSLARMGMPREIAPRYRSTYFQHIFSGGYSAGYYSYMWAEVLDADAFGAFEEKGVFDQATAASFRKNILEQGYNEKPMDLYKRFRGREPKVDYLLKRKGLSTPAAQP